MRGLIIKDLANLLTQKRILLILGILILAGAFIPEMNTDFSLGVLSTLSIILLLTMFSLDEQSNWNKFALTTSITRKDLVVSKYLIVLILSALSFVIAVSVGLINGDRSISEVLITAIMLISSTGIILAILMPPVFYLGVQKSKLFFMIPVFILILLGRYIPNISHLIDYLKYLPVVAIVLYFISMYVSLRLVAKKEYN